MSDAPQRLRLAIQKSGRLADDSIALLSRCGISLTRGKDQLFVMAQNFPLDVYFVRDDDIPSFVASNTCQIGIVGQNVLQEEKLSTHNKKIGEISVISELGFGKCRLSLAVPHDFDYVGPQSLQNKVIATTYEGILTRFLEENGIAAQIVTMKGAVEIAPRIKMADAICDLVSTGGTLAMNGLREVRSVFESQAVLVGNSEMTPEQQEILKRLLMRFAGSQRAQSSKYIMLHAPVDALVRIKSILPGSDSPTVLALAGRTDKVAVHAVCNEGVFWETMEDLKSAGASDILVLPIEKMLD